MLAEVPVVEVQAQDIEFQRLVQKMKQIKKKEYHMHLGGSWPLEYLKEIGDTSDFDALCAALKKVSQGVSYNDIFSAFGFASKIVNTNEKVKHGVVALCKRLAQDNVVYAEIRTGLKELDGEKGDYLQAVLEGMRIGSEKYNIEMKLLLSVRRSTTAKEAEDVFNLAKIYKDQGIIGFDISHNSLEGDAAGIFDMLAEAREEGFLIALHLGESPKEKPEQQIKELEKIKPHRIGHGVHLCEKAQQWIRENKIPVELCISSAVKVGMIENYHEHPALKLLEQGHPIVISTDDPLIFGSWLSEECARIAQFNKLSVEDIQNLQK